MPITDMVDMVIMAVMAVMVMTMMKATADMVDMAVMAATEALTLVLTPTRTNPWWAVMAAIIMDHLIQPQLQHQSQHQRQLMVEAPHLTQLPLMVVRRTVVQPMEVLHLVVQLTQIQKVKATQNNHSHPDNMLANTLLLLMVDKDPMQPHTNHTPQHRPIRVDRQLEGLELPTSLIPLHHLLDHHTPMLHTVLHHTALHHTAPQSMANNKVDTELPMRRKSM
jgi:hypothetical protein